MDSFEYIVRCELPVNIVVSYLTQNNAAFRDFCSFSWLLRPWSSEI